VFDAIRSVWSTVIGLLVDDGSLALAAIGALAVAWIASGALGDATGWLLTALVLVILVANVLSVGLRLRRRA
jgi:hypothetical protein